LYWIFSRKSNTRGSVQITANRFLLDQHGGGDNCLKTAKKAMIFAHVGRIIKAFHLEIFVKKSGFDWWRRGVALQIHPII